MEQTQQLLQKWDARARGLRPRMEISREGLTLGAGTVLAGMARDECGAQRLTLDDEPRVMALLVTAYEQPVEPYVLAKLRRACELWNEGETALAHIHLAHANLPPCDEEQALRLFVADELLEAVTPGELMKAQGFDPAVLKFNPDQPRVPAGSGRESGQWTSDGTVAPVNFRTRARMKALSAFIEWLKSRLKGPKHETPAGKAPPAREEAKPRSAPRNAVEAEDLELPKIDSNSLHHIFDDPDHGLDGLVTEFGSRESAFEAIAEATRDAVRSQGITGQYEIQVEVGGRQVTVRGRVVDGVVNIGTVFMPWKH